MVVCDEVCVWVVDGFPDDVDVDVDVDVDDDDDDEEEEEESLRTLLEAPDCMVGGGGGRSGVVVVVVVEKGWRKTCARLTRQGAGGGGEGQWGRKLV